MTMRAGEHVSIVCVCVFSICNFKCIGTLDRYGADGDILVFAECSGGHLKGETILAHSQYERVSYFPRQRSRRNEFAVSTCCAHI